ncbi:MAG: hypothetical protein IT381_13570 [Deltaproteobacteria bacterium]|nr:hypothetical protein [Deltaproteobacteria bacterium]
MAKNDALLDEILGDDGKSSSKDFDPATLKKIIEMNPEMLGNRSPEQFIAEMKQKHDAAQKQKQEKDSAKEGVEGGFMLPPDVDQLAIALEKKYALEKKELEDEIKRLTERQRSLKPRYRDVFMDKLLEIDPNLVSPKTGFVLKDKKTWLDEVGFSVELFIAHGRKRK